MQFTVKLQISISLDSKLYLPISRDSSNFKLLQNSKYVSNLKPFEYGAPQNKGIVIEVKKEDELLITYDVPLNPSPLNLDPKQYLSNGERYVKWMKNNVVEKFAKENRNLSTREYAEEAMKYVKTRLIYKGFTTGEVPDKYEFTDENLNERKEVDCVGFHGTMVALLRARGIPAVLDFGFRLGKGDNPHVWTVFFDKEWIRLDVLDDMHGLIGDNEEFPRVSVSVGTTHELNQVSGKDFTISYIQYILSDKLLLEGKRSATAVFDSFEKKSFTLALITKIFKGIFSYDDFLYILQLEDYLNDKFFKVLKRFLFRRLIQKRDTLKNTTRIQFIRIVTIALQLLFVTVGFFAMYGITADILYSLLMALFLVPAVLFAIPVFVAISNSVSLPLYNYFRRNIIRKATKKISEMKDLRVVMISGSYGKTSVKNFAYQMLSSVYRTQMTAGNINTHTGIALWINNSLNEGTQILICEVDGFHEGEVRDIAKMVPSDFAVITYLGDQHLERLESKKILAKTLVENITYSKPNSTVIASKSTIKDLKDNGVNIKDYLKGRKINAFEFNESFVKINPNLSSTNIKNVQYASEVAKHFDVPKDIIEDSIKNISLPERRQNVIIKNGFTVIDDSYNISFNTANEGLNRAFELKKKEKKRLLVIFAGIGELGRENSDANYNYAKRLSEVADNVVILNSIYRKQIESAFKEAGFTKYKVSSTMAEAVASYERMYNPSDFVILMHPELTDLYY